MLCIWVCTRVAYMLPLNIINIICSSHLCSFSLFLSYFCSVLSWASSAESLCWAAAERLKHACTQLRTHTRPCHVHYKVFFCYITMSELSLLSSCLCDCLIRITKRRHGIITTNFCADRLSSYLQKDIQLGHRKISLDGVPVHLLTLSSLSNLSIKHQRTWNVIMRCATNWKQMRGNTESAGAALSLAILLRSKLTSDDIQSAVSYLI